jgi:hypothetical protein
MTASEHQGEQRREIPMSQSIPETVERPASPPSAPLIGSASLSRTQRYVLQWLATDTISVQIAGHGNAPYLSAARALVRRGLAWTYATGHFGLTDKGRALAPNKEVSE